MFKEKGVKIIKDYFKKINRKTTDIYAMFISNLDSYVDDENKSLIYFQSETLKMIKKHKASSADVSALLYIRYLLTNNTIKQKNIIVNESQYYGKSMLSTLQKISPKSGLTIFYRNNSDELEDANFEIVDLNDVYADKNADIEKIKNPAVKVKQLKK